MVSARSSANGVVLGQVKTDEKSNEITAIPELLRVLSVNKTSIDYRYYIGSIENNAKLFAQSVRNHRGVENGLHWQLDMRYREDESRTRKGHSAENFAVMRHVTLNLFKKN